MKQEKIEEEKKEDSCLKQFLDFLFYGGIFKDSKPYKAGFGEMEI